MELLHCEYFIVKVAWSAKYLSKSEKMSMGNVYIKRRLPMKMDKKCKEISCVFFVNKFNDALPNGFYTTIIICVPFLHLTLYHMYLFYFMQISWLIN
jgi:hypothetical protein